MNIVLHSQLKWAAAAGVLVDERGYVTGLEANLWRPIQARARGAFARGSGSELTSKMLALHSSSALVVNFFEYWATGDARRLAAALELDSPINSIDFESQRPTGLPGTPPNLDICLTLDDGHVIAIESKFGEWLVPKPGLKEDFKPAYFLVEGGAWAAVGLPKCQRLAELIRSKEVSFKYLDATQLLKHALGMATCKSLEFSLCYLYYEWDVPQAKIHQAEISNFAAAVGDEVRFMAKPYQDLFNRIARIAELQDKEYLDYLRRRYFSPVL